MPADVWPQGEANPEGRAEAVRKQAEAAGISICAYSAGNDFVQLDDNGTDTTVKVDADGLANGASFTELVLLQDNTGLVVDDLLADGNLVVTV